MLAPPDKTLKQPPLQEEADNLLAQYGGRNVRQGYWFRGRPEDLSFHYRLDANGAPVFPIVARHTELIGANIWSGVKAEKNVPRLWGEWYRLDRLKTYRRASRSALGRWFPYCSNGRHRS
jgi:hypothetical protein